MLKSVFVGLVAIILSTQLLAQSPFGINYQGVARTADGTPISSKDIGLRISITQGPNGTADYSEEHALKTNEFGLFSVVIGKGQSSDNLQDVDWSTGNKWLEIELDPEGTGSFQLIGTQQMLSVPYALYSLKSSDQLDAGSGIAISNGDIVNTAPDQTVNLQGTGDIAVSGTYPNFIVDGSSLATTTYVDNSTNNIQTAVDANTAGLAAEIVSRSSADTNIQAELDATQSGAGLETNGSYLPDVSTTYLGSATDLKDADNILDAEVNANAGAISALADDLNTTYAFKGRFNFTNTTGGILTQDLPFSIEFAQDPTNFPGGDRFVAPEDGYYSVTVSVSVNDGGANIVVKDNGNSETLSKIAAFGSLFIIHERTTIYELLAGEQISINVENLVNNAVVQGEFTGHKL